MLNKGYVLIIFFFKQKTAYEVLISDWSSDVCSSDRCGRELGVINDLADAKANALRFKRDSVHGPFPGEVKTEGDQMFVNGKAIKVTAERDPANLPHAALGVDIALECTGFFKIGRAHV